MCQAVNKSSAVVEKRRHASKIIRCIQHCHGTVRFVICNTDVNDPKRGGRKFLID